MRNPEKTIGKIADKAERICLAYLEEADDDPTPTIRATLTLREREGIRVFYLTTSASPQKAADFRENPGGCLYFWTASFTRGVCLSGAVEVLETPEAKARFWRDGDQRYYPQGVTDPDYCVLKFTADRGRYYTSCDAKNFDIPN